MQCIDQIGCYVCNGKRPLEEEELLLCEGCGWRGAHYRCLGLPDIPEEDWFCFRCEDEAGRAEQAEAFPVLDVRVHEDYLAYATRKKGVSKKRPLDLEGQESEEGPSLARISFSTVPLKKVAVSNRVLAALREREGIEASNDNSKQKRARIASEDEDDAIMQQLVDCEEEEERGRYCEKCAKDAGMLNYCECGTKLTWDIDYLDHTVCLTSKSNALLASSTSKTVFANERKLEDGSHCLFRIVSPHGHYLALTVNVDTREMQWVKEKEKETNNPE